MPTLAAWAKEQGAVPSTEISSQREIEEAAVRGVLGFFERESGRAVRFFRRDAVSKTLLNWSDRSDPMEDALALWRKLALAARELPSFDDSTVSVSTVQRITLPTGQPSPEWVKRTGVVVLVQAPSKATFVGVFLVEP